MYKAKEETLRQLWGGLQEVWLNLYGSFFPTVAAINSHAPAGGCLLSLCCEYRIMLPKFTIGLDRTQLGMVPPTWTQAAMKNAISVRQTELALIGGRRFITEEALQIGLIDEIGTDKADALVKSEEFLSKFARISPVARSLTKAILRKNDIVALEEAKEQDIQLFVDSITDPKVQEGLKIYLESLKKK